MSRNLRKRALALLLALCLLCGSAGLAEAVKADKGTIRQVQEALNAAGFDCGTPDGISGKKTRSAIQEYQAANGLTADGEITEELLSDMGIELPGAGTAAELKEVKGNSPVRSVRVPIGGPAYVSNFDSETLRHVEYLNWNLRIHVVGRVVDLRGIYPVEQQKEERAILIQAADGSLFLADYAKSLNAVPDFRLGDQLTVSGSVGEARIGILQHPTPDYTFFSWQWGTLERYQQDVLKGYYDGMNYEATGDEALTIQADAVELGDRPAPTVKFESIALTPEHRLGTVVKDNLGILDAEPESGWLYFGSRDLWKGYASFTHLVNYYTGMVLPHKDRAEVYLCDDGLLQFEWRDAATGKVVDPIDTVLRFHRSFRGSDEVEEYDVAKFGEPHTFQMFLKYYDLNGELAEERLVGEYREDDDYQVYMKLDDDEKSAICREYKAHLNNWNFKEQKLLDNREKLEFVDENGDAVAYDSEGKELIRYPGTDASKLWGMLLKKQGIITVAYINLNGQHTEVFVPCEGGEASEAPSTAADGTVLFEKNAPPPYRNVTQVKDDGNSKYTSNVDYYGLLVGYTYDDSDEDSNEGLIRIVGTVTDLDGEYPVEGQKAGMRIILEEEAGEIYYVEYGLMETTEGIPDYQVGDVLTVCGRAHNRWDSRGDPELVVRPDFIAAGDVPAPDA